MLFKVEFEHAILDCGVGIFKHDPSLTEYPPGFLSYWKRLAKYLTSIFKDRIWITIPDYPDDYNPGQFGDNVSKTLKNVEEFIKIDGVNWLVVIQSRYLDKRSFLQSCKMTKELVGDYPRIAIGTVCKTNNIDFIEYCCRTARKFFPRSHIHAFGLTLRALPRVCRYLPGSDSSVADTGRSAWRRALLDSFDSMSYTFPRGPGRSCKNMSERIAYFYAYIKRVNEILESCAGTRIEQLDRNHPLTSYFTTDPQERVKEGKEEGRGAVREKLTGFLSQNCG